MKTKLVCSLLAAGALVAGCSATPSEKQDLMMRELLGERTGMVGIFPPREDVRVGDLYVYGKNPEAENLPLETTARWGSLAGITLAVQKQYNERPDFPATPEEYLPGHTERTGQRNWSEASFETGIYSDERPSDRLRMVVLPSITLSREAVGKIMPSDAINLASASVFDDWEAVNLRIQAAEAYSLDLDELLTLAVERDGVGRRVLKQPYRDSIGLAAGQTGGTVWVRIVSEVLFMRAAQFSIKAENHEPDVVRASELTLEPLAEGEVDPTLDPAFAAIARADAINNALREDGSDVLPDGFTRFLAIDDGFIAMQRVWRRAVAIGARGITLEVDSATGEVLASGMIGSPLVSRIPAAPAAAEEN